MEYKRLTERRETPLVMSMWGGTSRELKIYNRLAELEDKIENGTLVEMPRLLRYVDYCYGLEKFVVQWETNGKIKSKTFWNEKKAKKKLKELRDETN